jgi:hypothetical protein
MMKLFCGLASAALLFAGSAFAEPMPLSNSQMDQVNAGFLEIDDSNTSVTVISLFQKPTPFIQIPNVISCQGCFLLIISSTLSVGSKFGPPAT